MIPKSEVGVLSDDSRNVVELITKAYDVSKYLLTIFSLSSHPGPSSEENNCISF